MQLGQIIPILLKLTAIFILLCFFCFFLSRDKFFEVNECKLFLLLLVKKCVVSLEIIVVISLSIATVDSFKK